MESAAILTFVIVCAHSRCGHYEGSIHVARIQGGRIGEVDRINEVQEVLAVLKFSSLTFRAKAAVELMHPCLRRYAKFRARYTPAISLNSDSDSRTSDNFNHIDTHDKSPSTFTRDSFTPLAYN